MQQGIKESLLTKETSSSSSSSNVDRGEDEHLGVKYKIWNESKKLWVVAGPAIFTRFSTFGTQIISQAFIGHIGSIELAAFCLVFTVFVRFSNGILVRLHIVLLAPFTPVMFFSNETIEAMIHNHYFLLLECMQFVTLSCFNLFTCSWEWLVRWKLSAVNHMVQENTKCLEYIFKDHG